MATLFCLSIAVVAVNPIQAEEYDVDAMGDHLWEILSDHKPNYGQTSIKLTQKGVTQSEKKLEIAMVEYAKFVSPAKAESLNTIAPAAETIETWSYDDQDDVEFLKLVNVARQKTLAINKEKKAKKTVIAKATGEMKETVHVKDVTHEVVTEHVTDKPVDDIRNQTIDSLLADLDIDEAIIEAKAVTESDHKSRMAKKDVVLSIPTSSEVINGVIKSKVKVKRIDIDFDDTNLGDIMLTMSKIGEINLVLDPELKNNSLDLHLNQVTVHEALLLIASTYDLGFDRIGSSLYVTRKDNLREKSLTTQVIKLRNINVSEAKSLISGLAQTINTSEEINSLTVIGSPEEIKIVESVIAKIDVPQPQVRLEAKIIEVNKDALKDVGIDWTDEIRISYQEGARPIKFDNTEDSPGSPIEIFQIARNPIQFDTVIKMLENQNKAKVLSNPRITTMNDKEAEIFVGDEIPYTVTNVTGGVATTDVRFVEPGIRLKITPRIIEDDFVVIKVEPEVSFIFAFRGPNDEFPHVKTREATAHVRVKNNEPFIMGGILSQEDKVNLFKVPFFGDVPLLGNLFSYEKHTILDTELIISIIPTIVRGDM